MAPQIYLGDCLAHLRTMAEGSVDMTLTSPPYDGLRTYKGYSFDFEPIARELYRVTKAGGVVVWIIADATRNGCESLTSFKQAIFFVEQCGFRLADTMAYHKTDSAFPRHGHRKYPGAFEYMLVLSKGPVGTFNPIRDRINKHAGQAISGSVRCRDGTVKPIHTAGKVVAERGVRTNVWGYSTGFGKSAKDPIAYEHPAIFPEALARDHIATWSNTRDVVLDPFMGSGTTAVAALTLDRDFIGIELSGDYCDLSARRIANALGGPHRRPARLAAHSATQQQAAA